ITKLFGEEVQGADGNQKKRGTKKVRKGRRLLRDIANLSVPDLICTLQGKSLAETERLLG
ncbi:hypothetical protein Bpfe_000573, partial [Biomphalaria pfeifferi]